LFFQDFFKIELEYLWGNKPVDSYKNLLFALVIPKAAVQDQIQIVQSEVGSKITTNFIIPMSGIGLIIIALVSFLLYKISDHITEPISELYERIGEVI